MSFKGFPPMSDNSYAITEYRQFKFLPEIPDDDLVYESYSHQITVAVFKIVPQEFQFPDFYYSWEKIWDYYLVHKRS